MKTARFAFALDQTDYRVWNEFETLAAVFFASEFPNLRTLAAPQGDRGRDGILWQPEAEPTVVLQYSVTTDWRDKIIASAKRVSTEFSGCQILIYATNRVIGPAADDLVLRLRQDFGLFLDVRDRQFFLDRFNATSQNEEAAESLARLTVDPLLAEEGVVPGRPALLETHEAQTAVVHLAMQLADADQERGLTKASFEALARAALRDTDNDHRLARSGVHRRVREAVPTEDEDAVALYLDRALERLSKGAVRHWVASDEFCLSHEERTRLGDLATQFALLETRLHAELADTAHHFATAAGIELPHDLQQFCVTTRRVIEEVLLSRGENFAASVTGGARFDFTVDLVRKFTLSAVSDSPGAFDGRADLVSIAEHVIEATLLAPGSETHKYLRGLADAYTLMAFLRATPNVQATLLKLFSYGEIWLDTSMVLPLFAEQLAEPEDRRFTNLLSAARDAGLKIYITAGVLEEIERHMNRAIAFMYNQSQWEGRTPFLYSAYIWAGRSPLEFRSWIENYRGDVRPEADVADALSAEFRIEVRSLTESEESASDEIRAAVVEEWYEVHERRRARIGVVDEALALRMAKHDRENYLGVIQHRKQENESALGFSAWWLTLDRAAYTIHHRISDREPSFRGTALPILSPDFLINYLMIGPMRRQLEKGVEASLPLMVDLAVMEAVPSEVIVAANEIRNKMDGKPERVIRREVRDALDAAKVRMGAIAEAGIRGVEEDIEELLSADPAHS